MRHAMLMQVIETTIERRGDGTDADPVRIVRQYWTPEGRGLAEWDPWAQQAIDTKISEIEQVVDRMSGVWGSTEIRKLLAQLRTLTATEPGMVTPAGQLVQINQEAFFSS